MELRAEDSNDLQQYTYERKVEKVVVPLDDELKSVRDTFLQVGLWKLLMLSYGKRNGS